MGLSVWQLAIIAIVILVLFGRGRISEMMGDFGKGIKSFKQGMNEEDGANKGASAQIEAPPKQAGQAGDGKAADPAPSETTAGGRPADRGDGAS